MRFCLCLQHDHTQLSLIINYDYLTILTLLLVLAQRGYESDRTMTYNIKATVFILVTCGSPKIDQESISRVGCGYVQGCSCLSIHRWALKSPGAIQLR